MKTLVMTIHVLIIVMFFLSCTQPAADNPPAGLDPAIDHDGDGYTINDGDSDETIILVNPGAYEIVGNGIDDDGNPETSDTSPPADGALTADFTGVTPNQLAAAMELNRITTADPPQSERIWGVIDASFVSADGQEPDSGRLAQMMDSQAAVLIDYGDVIVPESGTTMVGLSTGFMRDSDDAGFDSPSMGTDFGDQGSPPQKYTDAWGDTLPGSWGCSGPCGSGNDANDSINLKLTIRVPTNARCFSYSYRFFTAEYGFSTCSEFNDFHLALLTTDAAGIPADTNIAFDSLCNPVSVNNLFYEVGEPKDCHVCPDGISELVGTGMDTVHGGGTTWHPVTAPVVPGEIIVLEIMIFDVSDGNNDSLVLIDNFQWRPQ